MRHLLLLCSYVAAQYAGLPLYGQASQSLYGSETQSAQQVAQPQQQAVASQQFVQFTATTSAQPYLYTTTALPSAPQAVSFAPPSFPTVATMGQYSAQAGAYPPQASSTLNYGAQAGSYPPLFPTYGVTAQVGVTTQATSLPLYGTAASSTSFAPQSQTSFAGALQASAPTSSFTLTGSSAASLGGYSSSATRSVASPTPATTFATSSATGASAGTAAATSFASPSFAPQSTFPAVSSSTNLFPASSSSSSSSNLLPASASTSARFSNPFAFNTLPTATATANPFATTTTTASTGGATATTRATTTASSPASSSTTPSSGSSASSSFGSSPLTSLPFQSVSSRAVIPTVNGSQPVSGAVTVIRSATVPAMTTRTSSSSPLTTLPLSATFATSASVDSSSSAATALPSSSSSASFSSPFASSTSITTTAQPAAVSTTTTSSSSSSSSPALTTRSSTTTATSSTTTTRLASRVPLVGRARRPGLAARFPRAAAAARARLPARNATQQLQPQQPQPQQQAVTTPVVLQQSTQQTQSQSQQQPTTLYVPRAASMRAGTASSSSSSTSASPFTNPTTTILPAPAEQPVELYGRAPSNLHAVSTVATPLSGNARPTVVSFDFDGTLQDNAAGGGVGQPYPKVIAFLKQFAAEGATIVIVTQRYSTDNPAIERFLQQNGIAQYVSHIYNSDTGDKTAELLQAKAQIHVDDRVSNLDILKKTLPSLKLYTVVNGAPVPYY